MKYLDNIVISGAHIGFKNFSGKEGKFNPPGRRNFCVFFEDDSELAEKLINDGWNVRHLNPKSEYDEPVPYLQVTVSFDNIPPKIILVTSRGKESLNSDTIGILDWAEIANVDLTIRPYSYEINGKSGIKAYCKNMYITLLEDEFEAKYYDVPDSAAGTVGGCGGCSVCKGGDCQNEDRLL